MHYNTQFLLFNIFGFAIVCQMFPVRNKEEAVLYLQRFGYLEDNKGHEAEFVMSRNNNETITNALKIFQRYAGIKQTGELDKESLNMMNTPRCGVTDEIHPHESARKKRYVLQGSKWRTTQLTYRITKYSTMLKDNNKIDEEIARAFKVWSDVTPLRFEERKTGGVNIEIRFEAHDHGDGFTFDGPGPTLAHAFFPQFGGDVHFDDEEEWTMNESSGVNLYQVAAHEFGHSLGLKHSDVRGTLMFAYDLGYEPYFKLHEDDIIGIQALYGKSDDVPPEDNEHGFTGAPPDTSDAPDLCQNASINTVTRIQNGDTYVFKGDFYWKILPNGIADGYPRRISDDWGGLEGNLDASLTWTNGKTYFFKDGRYWRFTNKEMDEGYPKSLHGGFEGIPESPDAAFVWSGNGKTYFFKGDKYWRFDSNSDPPVNSRYPMPINRWIGLPNNIDAAFQWENSRTYFFKADKYYGFNDTSFEVDSGNPPYPRATSIWWLNCQAISQNLNRTVTITEVPENMGSQGKVPERDIEFSGAPPDTSDAQDLCQNASIDTVTRTQDGNIYVFKGDFYWKIIVEHGIADGYPRRISDDWNGLEGNLDAAMTWANGKTYFFKGGRYWQFINNKMDNGYPKSLYNGFEGVPESPDAAFVWSANGKTYFFKGDQYWKYDNSKNPPVSYKYPKPISNWNGLPNNIDAAFQWGHNKTYFFKADKYYRFNDLTFEVDSGSPPYPRATSIWWFNCQAIPQNANTGPTSTDALDYTDVSPENPQNIFQNKQWKAKRFYSAGANTNLLPFSKTRCSIMPFILLIIYFCLIII